MKRMILNVLLVMGSLVCLKAQAQAYDWGWNWKDSSKVATSKMPQHLAFKKNQQPYPARPTNQYEVGVSLGYAMIMGDVRADWKGLNGIPSLGGGLSVRKALNHAWSWRLGWQGLYAHGLDWKRRIGVDGVTNASIWDREYNGKAYYANYRNKIHNFSGELVYSFNPIDNYRANPTWNYYIFGGASLLATDMNVNYLTEGGLTYDFDNIVDNPKASTSKIVNQLRDKMYTSKYRGQPIYEDGQRRSIVVNDRWYLRAAVNVGFGIAKKLNDKINVGIEQRFINAFSDELDGIREGRNDDIVSFTSVRLNYNIGKKDKSVQPLWWLNGNNYVYNELNQPSHMKLPEQKLVDADGDGIADQLDLEPNSPKGANVDSHGRAIDSDGDGVPDFKDKETLTQQTCFPVNADGVGTCPESPCCQRVADLEKKLASGKFGNAGNSGDCTVGSLPSIKFAAGKTLSGNSVQLLKAIAAKMKANPACKVKVIGHPMASKVSQQSCWERVNAIITYLIEKEGISESRFVFMYDGGSGDANTIDMEGTTEDGPSKVSAPHPNLK